jgi:hypothetical protein
MGFGRFLEQTAIVFPGSINQLVFLLEAQHVFCKGRTEILNIGRHNISYII